MNNQTNATAHTPGPWNANGTTVNGPGIGLIVATCSLTHFRHEPEANARLIAAAPELLAALEKFAEWDECYPGNINLCACVREAREAIAKATK